jgi:hypothetical protein
MIKVTRWSPDTCDCVVEYSWDSEVPQDERVHIPHTVLKQCEAHKNKPLAVLHDELKEENQRKNIALGEIIKHFPDLALTDQNGEKTSPDPNKIKYSFDKNRKLQVELKDTTPENKVTLRGILQTKFTDKVDLI